MPPISDRGIWTVYIQHLLLCCAVFSRMSITAVRHGMLRRFGMLIKTTQTARLYIHASSTLSRHPETHWKPLKPSIKMVGIRNTENGAIRSSYSLSAMCVQRCEDVFSSARCYASAVLAIEILPSRLSVITACTVTKGNNLPIVGRHCLKKSSSV